MYERRQRRKDAADVAAALEIPSEDDVASPGRPSMERAVVEARLRIHGKATMEDIAYAAQQRWFAGSADGTWLTYIRGLLGHEVPIPHRVREELLFDYIEDPTQGRLKINPARKPTRTFPDGGPWTYRAIATVLGVDEKQVRKDLSGVDGWVFPSVKKRTVPQNDKPAPSPAPDEAVQQENERLHAEIERLQAENERLSKLPVKYESPVVDAAPAVPAASWASDVLAEVGADPEVVAHDALLARFEGLSVDERKREYRRLSRKFHPDVYPDGRAMKVLTHVWEELQPPRENSAVA